MPLELFLCWRRYGDNTLSLPMWQLREGSHSPSNRFKILKSQNSSLNLRACSCHRIISLLLLGKSMHSNCLFALFFSWFLPSSSPSQCWLGSFQFAPLILSEAGLLWRRTTQGEKSSYKRRGIQSWNVWFSEKSRPKSGPGRWLVGWSPGLQPGSWIPLCLPSVTLVSQKHFLWAGPQTAIPLNPLCSNRRLNAALSRQSSSLLQRQPYQPRIRTCGFGLV